LNAAIFLYKTAVS